MAPISPDPFAASACASILCLYSAVYLRRWARATTSGSGRGAVRPPVMSPNTESDACVPCVAGRAEPFTVVMLSLLFPALLTNCGHTRCLSHVGTEGADRRGSRSHRGFCWKIAPPPLKAELPRIDAIEPGYVNLSTLHRSATPRGGVLRLALLSSKPFPAVY